MTTVAAVMARPYTSTMFDDLEVPAHTRAYDKQTGVTTLTFAGDLDEAIEDAVRDRMTSKDDADQAERAVIRDARDAVEAEPTLENVAALSLLTANYALGLSS